MRRGDAHQEIRISIAYVNKQASDESSRTEIGSGLHALLTYSGLDEGVGSGIGGAFLAISV